MKKVKLFLALFIPIFIAGAIAYYKFPALKWVGYVLAAVFGAGVAWVLYHTLKTKK